MDPLAGSQWSASGTVEGFATSAPIAVLTMPVIYEAAFRHEG